MKQDLSREQKLRLLADRMASVLVQWASMEGPSKFDNGDRSPHGAFLAILAATCDNTGPLPPEDVLRLRLTEVIAALAASRDGMLLLDCDYDPNEALATVARAAGLGHVTWPLKASVRMHLCEANGSGRDYMNLLGGPGAARGQHLLVPGGWLISNFDVPTEVLDLCLAAAKTGHSAMRFEPLADNWTEVAGPDRRPVNTPA